jgi:hypothetical protein
MGAVNGSFFRQAPGDGKSRLGQRIQRTKSKERGRVSTLDINATEETHSAKKEGSWVCQKLRHDPLSTLEVF